MGNPLPLQSLSDDELLHRLSEILRQSRRVEAELVAHIGEVDGRRLYAREAAPSMFAYCTDVLHLSEHQAYLRIAVARASREHPMLLTMLSDGSLHLSSIAKLVPHLTSENRDELLARGAHRSKREIEELVAQLAPRPDAPAFVRKLPQARRPGSVAEIRCEATEAGAIAQPELDPLIPVTHAALGTAGPSPEAAERASVELGPDRVTNLRAVGQPAVSQPAPRRPVVEALAPARYKVQFTAGVELRDKFERLQALMPDADLAQVIEQAVTEKLERLEARRFAKTQAPRASLAETNTVPASRHIPAAVRRAVYARDDGRCTYADVRGRRCAARADLEFHHHDRPYGRGGGHSLDNIRLMCHAHNAYRAEIDYGKNEMARYRRAPAFEPAAGHARGPHAAACPGAGEVS